MDGVLSLDENAYSDYTLHPDAMSAWITVDDISVYIVRTTEGVRVDLYEKGGENYEPIARSLAACSGGVY